MPPKYVTKTFTFNGKRYYARANDEKAALKKAVEMQFALEKEHIAISSSMKLKDWAEKCISTYKTNASEKTVQDFRYITNNIIRELGHLPLKSIKQMHCQQVLNTYIGKSKSSIDKLYQALQFLFKKAKQEKLINNNPAEFLTRPKGTQGHRRALTEEEQDIFTKVALTDTRYHAFLLMLYCGCRPSEAYACKGNNISKSNGIPLLHIKGTKTANANRFVPIPDIIYEAIDKTPNSSYIARTTEGNRITQNYTKKLWKSFKRAINIEMGCEVYRNQLQPPYPLSEDITQYCLRHTYCTNLAKKGIDIRTAQKLMGHSDISITANIYTHIDKSDILKAANLINK